MFFDKYGSRIQISTKLGISTNTCPIHDFGGNSTTFLLVSMSTSSIRSVQHETRENCNSKLTFDWLDTFQNLFNITKVTKECPATEQLGFSYMSVYGLYLQCHDNKQQLYERLKTLCLRKDNTGADKIGFRSELWNNLGIKDGSSSILIAFKKYLKR